MAAARIDFETCSTVDLKKSGTFRYVEDASTRVLCMAWCIGDGPVSVWRPGEPFPDVLRDHVEDRANTIEAWNAAGFERIVWALMVRDHGAPAVLDEQWRCTMIRAAYYGLPMSLDLAAKALRLSINKDMDGHRLMLQMCKPRRTKTGTLEWWDQVEPAKLDRLCAYCANDVLTEREVGRYIPALPDDEIRAWQLDTKINARGWALDEDLVQQLDVLTQLELSRLNAEIRSLTNGQVSTVNAVAALTAWVNQFLATPLEGLDKEQLKSALDGDLPDHVRAVLLIRQEAAKSSTAKITSMLASQCQDGAVRGLTQFYGAGRTGRWAGRLVQIQNLPRPVIKKIPAVIDRVLDFRDPGAVSDWLRDFEGYRPLDAVSSVLRGCFVPRPGHKLIVGDFAQIEARVVAWLAGQQDILDVFASGQDVYVYTAAKLGSTNRQLGKVLVLACGFGMGWAKFLDTAKTYGITLTDQEAEDAVTGWRSANPKIKDLWWACDRAARDVLEGRQQIARVGKLAFAMGKGSLRGCLLMRLPSGRVLVYRDARLAPDPLQPERGDQITYNGVNQTTKRWETLRTYGGKLVENATQAVARDLLREALQRIEDSGIPVLATIHDEAVCETPLINDPEKVRAIVEHRMQQLPAWAAGLPVGADVKIMERYGK